LEKLKCAFKVIKSKQRLGKKTSQTAGSSEASAAQSGSPSQTTHKSQSPPEAPGTSGDAAHAAPPRPDAALKTVIASPPPPELSGTEQSLWGAAAASLDPDDRKKLDGLVGCKSGSQGDDPSRQHVDLILSRAKELKEGDKKATWRPVSSFAFQSLHEACLNSIFRSSIKSSMGR